MELNKPRPIRPRERQKQQEAGRVCAEPTCDTRLSRYNPGALCSAHAQDEELDRARALPRHTRVTSA